MYDAKAFKGVSFETLVGIALVELCKKQGWLMLSDVRLRSQSERGYTQIDFLVFTPSKYYCIETKDWNCTVMCSEDRYWTAKYKNTLKTLNPAIQNNNHISKLCRRIPAYRIEGIVCFSNSTIIENAMKGVMNFSDMIIFLEEQGMSERKITKEQINEDFSRITSESTGIKLSDIDLYKI